MSAFGNAWEHSGIRGRCYTLKFGDLRILFSNDLEYYTRLGFADCDLEFFAEMMPLGVCTARYAYDILGETVISEGSLQDPKKRNWLIS